MIMKAMVNPLNISRETSLPVFAIANPNSNP
jgi:hypothetical protein